MHRIVGGKHSIVIVDGNIRDVLKVASPIFRSRPAERPRRNGGLIAARTHNCFERDPVAADSDPPRLGIVKRRDGGPRGESILLSHGQIIQFAIPLIADSGQQIQIREGGAVLDNQGIGSIVAEAMRRDIHFEAELQRVAPPAVFVRGKLR